MSADPSDHDERGQPGAAHHEPPRAEAIALAARELGVITGELPGTTRADVAPRTAHLTFDDAGRMLPCACEARGCPVCIANVERQSAREDLAARAAIS